MARLVPQKAVYKGDAPGHGGFFKWSTLDDRNRRPKMILRNNIFMAEQDANYSDLSLDPGNDVIQSENNTIIWVGPGDYPEAIPFGWKVTRNRSLWDAAVYEWRKNYGRS